MAALTPDKSAGDASLHSDFVKNSIYQRLCRRPIGRALINEREQMLVHRPLGGRKARKRGKLRLLLFQRAGDLPAKRFQYRAQLMGAILHKQLHTCDLLHLQDCLVHSRRDRAALGLSETALRYDAELFIDALAMHLKFSQPLSSHRARAA